MNDTAEAAIERIRADFPNVDVGNPDTFETGFPYEYFRRLRTECPIHFHRPKQGGTFHKLADFWVITKWEHIREISRNPQDFSSWRRGTNIEEYHGDDLSAIQMMLVNMDPPQHVKFRKLVSTGFTPRMIRNIEPKIRSEVAELLDGIQGQSVVDFVTAIAAELPLRIICELIGVPREDRWKIFDWSNRLIGFDDPEFQTSMEDAHLAAMEIWQYANEMAEEREGTLGEDLVRVLMNAEVDGEKLSIAEFDGFILLLAVAGNETTRNAISHGIYRMIQHPDQWKRLQNDPSLLDLAVDEIIRWATPVMYFRRVVTRDLEFHGHQFKENESVALYYPSANFDEDVFENADAFDVGRTPNDHIAFGYGEHFCLGANLARLEIKLLLEQMIERIDSFESAGDLRFLRSNFINGIKSMPVKLNWR